MSRSLSVLLLLGAVLAVSAQAAVIGYVNNPTTNSVDWATAVAGLGGAINTNVNFDTHPLGALQNNFYSISDGLTFSTTGSAFGGIENGQGPSDGNTTSTPLSAGEGLHPVSNYLLVNSLPSVLTLTFNTRVVGAGLFLIDYYNADSAFNGWTVSAYTGPNGTGTMLGSFNSAVYNFQPNNMYFMGILSTDGDIRSVAFEKLTSNTGDTAGIDNIQFAASSAVPEPGSVSLLSGALLGILGFARRFRR